MKPTGQDIAIAVREWAKDQLKQGPSACPDLGKFFFGVSTASLGAVVGFNKMAESLAVGWSAFVSVGVLALAAFVALSMVIPRIWPVGDDTDLFHEHKKQIQRTVCYTWTWFGVWLIGAAIGVCSVLVG